MNFLFLFLVPALMSSCCLSHLIFSSPAYDLTFEYLVCVRSRCNMAAGKVQTFLDCTSPPAELKRPWQPLQPISKNVKQKGNLVTHEFAHLSLFHVREAQNITLLSWSLHLLLLFASPFARFLLHRHCVDHFFYSHTLHPSS